MLSRYLNEISSNSVKNLNLAGTDFFDDFGLVCKALEKNTSVESLDISFCNLYDFEISQLAEALIVRPSSLKKLNIKDNLLKNPSLTTIIKLFNSGKVEEIRFDKNQFNETSADYQNFEMQLSSFSKKSIDEEKQSNLSIQATEQNLSNLPTHCHRSFFSLIIPSTPDSNDSSSTNKPDCNNGIK